MMKSPSQVQFRYSGAALSIIRNLYGHYRQDTFRYLEGINPQNWLARYRQNFPY